VNGDEIRSEIARMKQRTNTIATRLDVPALMRLLVTWGHEWATGLDDPGQRSVVQQMLDAARAWADHPCEEHAEGPYHAHKAAPLTLPADTLAYTVIEAMNNASTDKGRVSKRAGGTTRIAESALFMWQEANQRGIGEGNQLWLDLFAILWPDEDLVVIETAAGLADDWYGPFDDLHDAARRLART
jgi:hypothetical protein